MHRLLPVETVIVNVYVPELVAAAQAHMHVGRFSERILMDELKTRITDRWMD